MTGKKQKLYKAINKSHTIFEQQMNANLNKKATRKPLRGAMIRIGVTMLVASSVYLVGGLLGWFALELEKVAWNNIRIISGVAIAGCLLAAIGYGDE